MAPADFYACLVSFAAQFEGDGIPKASLARLARTLAALPPEQSAAQQPATDAVDYGIKLIAEAIEAHFGEREDSDDEPEDTTNRDVWDAFDALAALSQSPAKPAGDSLQQRPAAEEKRP